MDFSALMSVNIITIRQCKSYYMKCVYTYIKYLYELHSRKILNLLIYYMYLINVMFNECMASGNLRIPSCLCSNPDKGKPLFP